MLKDLFALFHIFLDTIGSILGQLVFYPKKIIMVTFECLY